MPPAQRKSWYDARADIGGDAPESSHEMEMVGRVTVSPAAGDVNLTSAKTEGISVANSQANLRIMVVVLLGVRVGKQCWGINAAAVRKAARRRWIQWSAWTTACAR